MSDTKTTTTKTARAKVDDNADPRPKRLQTARNRAGQASAILKNSGWLNEFVECARIEATLRAKVTDGLKED